MCEPPVSGHRDPATTTLNWVRQFVVGLNLCPFAAPVLRQQGLKIVVCEAVDSKELIAAVLEQLDWLQQQDEGSVATSLLVFSRTLTAFDDYWQFVGVAEQLLADAGLEGVIQIASFHPDYCFAGVDPDDVSHFSNRSPFPMLHFIREAHLSRVLDTVSDPDSIPDANIRRLRTMGREAIDRLLKQC